MSYNNTKLQEKTRYNAIKEVKSGRRIAQVARRPHANYPGVLVEVDTVHFYHPITKERKYATSVIDVYSRMAFVYFHDNKQQHRFSSYLKIIT